MRLVSARAASAVLTIVTVMLLGLLYRKSGECDRQSVRLDTLYGQAKALEEVAALNKQRADSVVGLAFSPIHPLYIDRLRGQGLRDPIAELIGDLRRHPELIPYSGTHGGGMGFYAIGRIRVLSDTWVYAPFDDGHIGGEAILEYRVAPGGAISWRVLRSRMQ